MLELTLIRAAKRRDCIVMLVGFLSLTQWKIAMSSEKTKDIANTICPVHKIQMTQEQIRIAYGRPKIDRDYSQARGSQFPNAREKAFSGGCVRLSEDMATVLVCPECTAARELWLKSHHVSDVRV